MMRILVVEDEEKIRSLLDFNLNLEGYEVEAVADGKSALDAVDQQHFDLIVLDVMLPEADGFEVCEKIRLKNNDVPIIFLTARDASADKIKGLRKGGDDYLTKPFNLEELLLRIKNLLKRRQSGDSMDIDTYAFGENVVNFKTYSAQTQDGNINLTNKEAMLLKMLVERKNEVVSRKEILQYVWGYDVFPSTRTIDNFILSFRKYFEKNPKQPEYFQSVRGVGYRFVPPGS